MSDRMNLTVLSILSSNQVMEQFPILSLNPILCVMMNH